ncbi:hypothetical protein H0O00_00810 [Candidatus Micrarchaeota archaeon]|nr:hypothetical protein [Candidatus Micrarchaeota archaeon]
MRKIIFFPEEHTTPRYKEVLQEGLRHKKESRNVSVLIEGIPSSATIKEIDALDLKARPIDHPTIFDLNAIFRGLKSLARVHAAPFEGDMSNAWHVIDSNMLPVLPEAPTPKECLDSALATMWKYPIRFSQPFLDYLERSHTYLDSLNMPEEFRQLSLISVIFEDTALLEILNPQKLHDYLRLETNQSPWDFDNKLKPLCLALNLIREKYMAHSINQQTQDLGLVIIGAAHVNDHLINLLHQFGLQDLVEPARETLLRMA